MSTMFFFFQTRVSNPLIFFRKHPSLQIFCKKDYTEIKVGNIKTDHHFKAKLTASSGLSLIESSLPEFRINMADEDSNNSIFKSNTTLSSIFDAFLMVLENMQEFYKNLDTIDQLCDVVEPQTITTKTNWRLIKFQEKVFLKIEIINPLDVSSVRCNFFGRDSDVNELNKIFEEKQEDKWDCSIDIYKNLLRIFDLMFLPMKADDEIEDDLPPCNICFSYRSEELQIPLISCNNKKCDSIFHVFCLDKVRFYLKFRV